LFSFAILNEAFDTSRIEGAIPFMRPDGGVEELEIDITACKYSSSNPVAFLRSPLRFDFRAISRLRDLLGPQPNLVDTIR
jgi:hypothetical protein